MISMPHGMRVSFTVYMTSDVSGLDAFVAVEGRTRIPEKLAALVDAAISTAGRISGIEDFRPMTDEEVTAYLKAQAEEEDDDDE